MKFREFCFLLAAIEKIVLRDPPLPAQLRRTKIYEVIDGWFRANRRTIDSPSFNSAVLLSALFPEWRSDRVYMFQPAALSKALGRCFLLGSTRQQELEQWRHGLDDLGLCVERVVAATPPDVAIHEVTLEDVDEALEILARRSRFSGPAVRARGRRTDASTVDATLKSIYRRLQPQEAKIFTRMILKDYRPVELPQYDILRCYHHLMPVLMKVYDNLEEAVKVLHGPNLGHLVAMPDPQKRALQRELASLRVSPKIGVKVGRPAFLKARSIKNTFQLASGRTMSLERKYDGEYCQIHVDLRNPGREIQTFSKRSKDSTVDRSGVHDAIKEGLRIGHSDCLVTEKCILEGELLVWSGKEREPLPFHKLRKHVPRSGSFLGTALNSQVHPWENLMVVFFDVMLIDDENLLNQPYVQRRKRLCQIVRPIQGKAAIVEQETINFSSSGAQTQLLQALAACFTRRWEGFVMKPYDEPYVNFREAVGGQFPSCWIKLKKDYIPGLGDTADLTIVGAGHDASASRNPKIKWTHFHIGCLRNKADVLNHQAKPEFLVIDAFSCGVPESQMLRIQNIAQARAIPLNDSKATELFDFDVEPGLACGMSVVFREPLVFEILGSGFDKCPNRDYFQLRFPRMVKVQWDRSFKETVDFKELQTLAIKAMEAPVDDLAEEVEAYVKKLEPGMRPRSDWPDPVDDSQVSDDDDECDIDEVMPIPQKPAFIRTDTIGLLPSETAPRPLPTFTRSITAPMTLPQEGPRETPKHTGSLSSASKMVVADTYISARGVKTSSRDRKRQRELEYSQPDSEPTPKRPSPLSSMDKQAFLTLEKEEPPLSEIINSAQRSRKRPAAGVVSPPKRRKISMVGTNCLSPDLSRKLELKKSDIVCTSAEAAAVSTSNEQSYRSLPVKARKKQKATPSPTSTSIRPDFSRTANNHKIASNTSNSSNSSSRESAKGIAKEAHLSDPTTPGPKRPNSFSFSGTTTTSTTDSSSLPTTQEPKRVTHSSPPSSPSIRPSSVRKKSSHNRNSSGISTFPLSAPFKSRTEETSKAVNDSTLVTSLKPAAPPQPPDPAAQTQSIPPVFFFGTALPADLRKPQTKDCRTVPISQYSPKDILEHILPDQKVLILIDTHYPEASTKDLQRLIPMARELGKIGRDIEIWDWGGEPLEGEWWAESKKLGRRRRRIVGMMKASSGGGKEVVQVEWEAGHSRSLSRNDGQMIARGMVQC